MHTVFISDLHLEEQRPEIANIFFKFLKNDLNHAAALYILGDFFEAWIGDDDQTAFNQSIIAELKHLTTRGLPVYIMRGNRDFLLGKRFMRESGCQLLPDEKLIDLYGVPTLLMHGDTLCTLDTKYLEFRKRAHNIIFQKLLLMKSVAQRKAIAEEYRAKSKAHTSMAAEHIMDVTQAEVERVMTAHKAQRLIHGHTHRPAVHELSLQGQAATRTVLAAWHEHGHALICDAQGQQELITFD